MPKILYAITLVFLISCNPKKNRKAEKVTSIQSPSLIHSAKIICDGPQRYFGDVSVCLPEIDGHIECLDNKLVKERVKEEVQVMDEEVLGIYLPAELYNKFLKNPSKTLLTEYIKVYGIPALKNKKVPDSFFKQMAEKIEKESDMVPWDETLKRVHDNNPNLRLGKPVLVEHSKYHPQTDSYIYLGSYNSLGKSGYIIWIANFCIIRDRLIYFANYINYGDGNSMEKLKNKNLLFTRELMELNQQ